MTLYMFKTIMSLLLLLSALIAMYSMFEIFGRKEQKKDPGRMRRIHRVNGICYFVIYSVVAYFCIGLIASSKGELTVRGMFHSLFALAVPLLMALKVAFVRVYRQYYDRAKSLGLAMALLTFGITATSGGYYLVVTGMGSEPFVNRQIQIKTKHSASRVGTEALERVSIAVDEESIERGQALFVWKCQFCHDAYSTATINGPGLKGILKGERLPVSRRQATAFNIMRQLREPYSRMPSFASLSEDEMSDLLAYLNTL